VPSYVDVETKIVHMRKVGSYVGDWRRPSLDYSDRVIVLLDAPGVEPALRTRFPDRAFYRLTINEPLDTVQVDPVPAPGDRIAASR
jgi:hypothetical protein